MSERPEAKRLLGSKAIRREGQVRIAYVGHELVGTRAPHQAMAAIWAAINGHRVIYLATGSQGPAKWAAHLPSLRYKTFKGMRRVAGLALIRYLFVALLKREVDCVYVQGAQWSVLCAWVPLLFPNIKMVYHTQDFKPRITRLYSFAEGFLARRSDIVISNEINRAKVMQVVHKLADTPAVIRTALPRYWVVPGRRVETRQEILERLPAQLREDAVLIAAGGPFMTRRKSRELVQSLVYLDSVFCLVFSGMSAQSPEARACMDVAEEVGVRHRIVILPRLDYHELLAVYAACEVGVLLYCDTDLANFYQGPGRVTEYLRAGIPVVASNFPGLELLIRKYGLGETADPNDPKDIARALKDVAPKSEELRVATAERLRRIGRDELAYEKDASRVLGALFHQSPSYPDHPIWKVIAEGVADGIGRKSYD